MDRSALFNNVGARMMEVGRDKVALDLFRAALESKLAFERHRKPTSDGTSSPVRRCVTPDCVTTAEHHLVNIEAYTTADDRNEEPTVEEEDLDRVDRLIPLVPLSSRGYDPYVYIKAFELFEHQVASTQLTSAIIVFNLGLVHHFRSRTSPKAAAFYEISAALLASEPESADSILLRIALLNNFGAWCYENGDGESLRTCMEHLSAILEASVGSITLNSEVGSGVNANIRWLLLPPNGGSPAA